MRHDECVECCPTPHDSINEFDGQSSVFGLKICRFRQRFVEQFGDESAVVLVLAEDLEGDAARRSLEDGSSAFV